MDTKTIQVASLINSLNVGAVSIGWIVGKLEKMVLKGDITEDEKANRAGGVLCSHRGPSKRPVR